MNFAGSKKKMALAGVLCGLVAACLASFGNPANMAICVASVIQQVRLECIRQQLYSMRDRR